MTDILNILMTSRPAGLTPTFRSRRRSAARVAAGWLCLAATPSFALMALLTACSGGGGQHDMLCASVQHASPLSGMAPMYVLMSVFHVAPWLKRLAGRRDGAWHRPANTRDNEAAEHLAAHLLSIAVADV